MTDHAAANPALNVRNSDGEVEQLWTGATVTHRFVDVDGLRWHAATAGDPANPDVIVFMHGFPETWFAWHHQMTALADRFYCVAIDLKGYGQSDTTLDTDYDYAAQARAQAKKATKAAMARQPPASRPHLLRCKTGKCCTAIVWHTFF